MILNAPLIDLLVGFVKNRTISVPFDRMWINNPMAYKLLINPFHPEVKTDLNRCANMSKLPDQIDGSTLDSLALITGTPIPESSRAGVTAHLTNALKMAELLYNAPLDDNHFEMAPTFCPSRIK